MVIDLARALLEKGSNDPLRRKMPVTGFQLLFTAIAASVYTFFIFVGVGFWTPFIFIPPVFVVAWFVARRNIAVWYQQGQDYEERLKQADVADRYHQEHKRWLERHPPEDPLQRM